MLPARGVEQVHEVLRCEVARSTRRVWTPAGPAGRRIEAADPGIQAGDLERIFAPFERGALGVSQPQIAYGARVTLTGQVNNKKAGENVQLSYQPYGQASEIVLATVITGTDGTFSYAVAPKILTNYRAKWKTASSLVISTAVAPSISFGRNNGFLARVYAGRSMARKQIQLQRLSAFGQWVTIKRVFLDLNARARFQATLPCGANRLRIAMSVNQSGAGYLGAFSRETTWRRAC